MGEYLTGGPLSSLLSDPEKRAKMSWPLLIRIAHDLALAIQYLHNQTPQLIHGKIDMGNILIVDLDVNADQVVKLTEISLMGDNCWWVDTAAYVSIIRELVDSFVAIIEDGSKSKSAVVYAHSLLDKTESESEDSYTPRVETHNVTQKDLIKGAIGAEVVYDAVSSVNFMKEFNASELSSDLLPHVRSQLPPHAVIPKIFQRILQFTGQKKLPDFDQICSLFTTYLDAEKTTELIKIQMGNFAQQMTSATVDDSPPPRRRRTAGDVYEDIGDSTCTSE